MFLVRLSFLFVVVLGYWIVVLQIPESIQVGWHTHLRSFDQFSFLLGMLVGAMLVFLVMRARRGLGSHRRFLRD